MRRALRCLPLLLVLLASIHAAPAAFAQLSPDAIPVYGGSQRATFAIAVPEFAATGAERISGPDISSIIANDLKLSGFFRPPDNPQFAAETDRLDRSDGTIHYAEWHRIGVSFLVRGEYLLQGGELEAEVKVYDTVSQNYVFGKRYRRYPLAQMRQLAHQIGDDIIERLMAEKGNSSSRILFVRQVDPYGKTKQVCVMDADGQGVIAHTGQGELTATPAWGARGTEIYYTTYIDFNPDLRGMILANRETWWVSRRVGLNLSPAWSETRQSIALTLTRDGNSELYTMQRDGKNAKRITNNRAIDSSPCWSPDGRKLAFQSDRSGGPQIWIMDMQSMEEDRLTFHSSYNDAPSWAPSGPDRIAFCSRIDGFFHIFTCRPDGSDLQQLTSGGHNNEDPTWAPNGLELAFTSDRSGRKQIYRMFADGSNLHQITNESACQSPAWSPGN
jgi:TolB protein